MKDWVWNPKSKGSGIITCIPQKGLCPNKCEDCFFQSGRSYLKPLSENIPHIPKKELTKNRIVRMNDGNDSNFQRGLVERVARGYDDYFFNTAIPVDLRHFFAPVVLTINPGKMTCREFYKVEATDNLMFVRIRTNLWNIKVVKPAIEYYTSQGVVIVLTFMAYFTTPVPKQYEKDYEWKKRTLNSYWVLKQGKVDEIMAMFKDNPFVYSCGVKGRHECIFCGNCVREYYNAKERMRGVAERKMLK